MRFLQIICYDIILRNSYIEFIFMNTEVNSAYFSPFPNLFADTPFNYINSKGETIPTGEDIMDI
jgi:hypothetical protein